MNQTPDFRVVVNNGPKGNTIIHSMNESAFKCLTEELQYETLPNGDAEIANASLDAFLNSTEKCHLWSEIV